MARLSSCCLVLAAVAGWVAGGPPARAQDRQARAADRRQVESQLETVRVRLVTLTSQYEELEKQKNDNVQQSKAYEGELAALNLRHARAVEALDRIREDLRRTEAAHAEHLQRFSSGLAQFYRLKNRPFVAYVLNSKDMAEFSRRYKYLQYIFQQDYRALEGLYRTRKELAAKQAAVESATRDLETLRKGKTDTGRVLTETIARGQTILESLGKEREKAVERARQLQASLDYISAKMRQTARAVPEPAPLEPQPAAADLPVPTTTHRTVRPGRVAWPVDTAGEVQIARAYGQSRTETGSLYFNPGIDILVKSQQTVRAVEGGKVMHRGDMPNFGKVVFIDHGGNPDKIISIYGNLDEILVPVGQEVARGQAVGSVGPSGGTVRDTMLHFEIRQNAVHQDPLRWLQGGRQMIGRIVR